MKKLLVVSGKGGTGKTTVASAFIAFAKAEAYADCDVDAPNLHLALKQSAAPRETAFYGAQKARVDANACTGCGACLRACRFHAVTLAGGKAAVDPLACEGCGVCERLCPSGAVALHDDVAGALALYTNGAVFSTATLRAGRGNSGKLVTEVKLALFAAASGKSLAVIDGAPGIGCPVIASLSGTDLALAVAEPSVSGASDLRRLAKTAAVLGTRLAVCVNKWDLAPDKTRETEAFCAANRLPFVGKIPYDAAIPRAINGGVPVASLRTEAAAALRSVYKNTISILYANAKGEQP